MVHFAIGTKIYLNDPSPNLLLGSIAPDAIHMRDNVTRKDKGYTHLFNEDTLPSLETIKTNCLKYFNENSEVEWKDYILGYFAHLYADLRWTETIYAEFERNYQGNKQDIRNIYNEEVSQVEFNLLKSEEWAQSVITKLQRAKAFSIEPFITDEEVSQYRNVKIEWLQDNENEPKIKPIYFTEESVKSFIIKTSNELNKLFEEWGVEFLKEGRNIS
jgi:hypothetical protein